VKRPGRGLLAEGEDHPLNLAPSAEMDDVAEIAAFTGARPRFRHGMVAETGKKRSGLGKRAVAGDVNIVTQSNPPVVLENHL
jgi:hypothetical protein